MVLAALTMALATVTPAQDVVILRPNAYLAEHRDKVGEATKFLNVARGIIGSVGLTHHTVNEADVLADGFPQGQFLLCAYNPTIPEGVQQRIQEYLDAGGHALFTYYLPEILRERLGLAPLEYAAAGDEKLMEYLATAPDALPGQPKNVKQSSWNAHITEPTRDDVRVVAKWLSADRETSPGAALFVGPEAAYMGHLFTDGDQAEKAALLVSVISNYYGGTWNLIAKRAMTDAFEFRHAPGVEAFRELCQGAWYAQRLAKLETRAQRIEILRMTGRKRKAYRRAKALRNDVERLYLACMNGRKDEFRAAWVVMPGGVGDGGWEKTARVAKRNGLDALFVRVEWRGTAHYKSTVLRIDEDVIAGDDPLAEAIEACHRHGLEVHAWFINNNWRTPSADLIEEFSKAGRWQVAPDGQDRVLEGGERVYWVNPSDPRNVQLEADMMAEVAREYDVDGVHFDYIRYENYSGSYGDADRERFERDTGLRAARWPEDVLRTPRGPLNEPFLEWRVEQISDLVEACSDAVKAEDPECDVSAAVYPAWPAHRLIVGQDWPRWLEEGWIDFVCPMNYDSPSYYERHEGRVVAQREAAPGFPVYSGIGAWLQPNAIEVADQIVTDRANGADGFLLFSFTEQFGEEVLPRLRRGPLK